MSDRRRPKPHPPLASPEFETQLGELEQRVQGLRQRYASVCADQQRLGDVHEQIQRLEKGMGLDGADRADRPDRPDGRDTGDPDWVDPEWVATLAALRSELATLEDRLDAQFVSWDGIGTLFWQVVGLGGWGLVLGGGLRSWVG